MRAARFSLLKTLYADDVMAAIWSERKTVQTWLDVEAALARSQAEAGVLGPADAEAIAVACRGGCHRSGVMCGNGRGWWGIRSCPWCG